MIAPRRLECRFMILTNEDKPKDHNDYLVINSDCCQFVGGLFLTNLRHLNHYINKLLIFSLWLETNFNVLYQLSLYEYRRLLLKFKKNEIISARNFSNKISNVFQKVYGLNISKRDCRCSAATQATSTQATNLKISKKDWIQLSKSIGHSFIQNLSYSSKLL